MILDAIPALERRVAYPGGSSPKPVVKATKPEGTVARRDSKARLDAYEAVFSALAHPARRRVLLAIHFSGGSMTAGEIAAMFAHAWQTTTRHLQVLEAAGLVKHQKRGRLRLYRIELKRLELVHDWLAWFSRHP